MTLVLSGVLFGIIAGVLVGLRYPLQHLQRVMLWQVTSDMLTTFLFRIGMFDDNGFPE